METFYMDMQGDVCQTDVSYKVASKGSKYREYRSLDRNVRYSCRCNIHLSVFGQASVCVIEETGHKVSP